MNKTLIRVRAIVTMDPHRRILPDAAIVVNGNIIERVLDAQELARMPVFDGDIVDAKRLVCIPGFIHTHIHLCQTLFRGLADDLELLDWLKLRIFPFEAAHDETSIHASAMLGIAELIRSGATTIMDMGSVHHEEAVIHAIEDTGLRAFVGKAMMDVNELYPQLKEPTRDAVRTTLHLAEQWHNKAAGRIRYAVAPRFVLSCTDELLLEAYRMTQSFPGMLFHTHAAENRHEMEAVRKRCGKDNIEFFHAINILHSNTCLAHCIWLNDREMDMMVESNARVAHCPSSNLKLGSGVANIPEMLRRGITVSLGADGAPCNNTLNMFDEMRLAALVQKPLHGPTAMNAATVFELATLGGARTLGIDTEVGSVEAGKKADVVLLDLDKPWIPVHDSITDTVYSSIVYSCSAENVESVMIDGRWVYRNGRHTTLQEEQVVSAGKQSLKSLLNRL
ncbi:MAG: 5'-deoxyadenosine deaminase [Bacteroidota bacterium]